MMNILLPALKLLCVVECHKILFLVMPDGVSLLLQWLSRSWVGPEESKKLWIKSRTCWTLRINNDGVTRARGECEETISTAPSSIIAQGFPANALDNEPTTKRE